MKLYTDRFETVLPPHLRQQTAEVTTKPIFRKPSPRPAKRATTDTHVWQILAGVYGFLLCAFLVQLSLRSATPPAVVPPTNPTPVPIAPVVSHPRPSPSLVEVRRAEPAVNDPQWYERWRYEWVEMPYSKEQVLAKYLGKVPNQESLPLAGNHIGDAYQVGGNPNWFVWVTPGGVGQWIDPVR